MLISNIKYEKSIKNSPLQADVITTSLSSCPIAAQALVNTRQYRPEEKLRLDNYNYL